MMVGVGLGSGSGRPADPQVPMEGVLLCPDLLCVILRSLHHRQAHVAACTCLAWRDAVARLTTDQRWPFRPQILIGCSRSCQIVDISSLVDPIPGVPLPQPLLTSTAMQPAQGSGSGQGKRKKNTREERNPSWVTSIAISPYGRKDLHVCQYNVMGVVKHCGTSLRHMGTVVHHSMLKEPEGVAFVHGFMYVQNNWGQLVRCSLEGTVIDRVYVGGELVTWAVVTGPDNHLYISADKQYKTRIYTDVPDMATGCILRAPLLPDGRFESPPSPFTHEAMKRPCGLRWGPVCNTLFVACLDPGILRFAGPNHASPGSLLSRISLSCCCPGLLPWDVVITHGTTLVVSMHRRRTLKPPKQEEGGSGRGGARQAPRSSDQAQASPDAPAAGPSGVHGAGPNVVPEAGSSGVHTAGPSSVHAAGPSGVPPQANLTGTGTDAQPPFCATAAEPAGPCDNMGQPAGTSSMAQTAGPSSNTPKPAGPSSSTPQPAGPSHVAQFAGTSSGRVAQPADLTTTSLKGVPPAPTRRSNRRGAKAPAPDGAPSSTPVQAAGPELATSPPGQGSSVACGSSRQAQGRRQQLGHDDGSGVVMDGGWLCIIPECGEGEARVVKLPGWMDHANMMCTDHCS